MLHFFRKIRWRLAHDNQFLNYSRYAIGEIVLVVIGILIALQINNWNEERKERKQERKILNELLTSLEQNYNMMRSDSINRSRWNRSSEIVIHALEEGVPYSDTMNIHFQNARKPGTNLSLSFAGYEGLKNIGYDIIRSDLAIPVRLPTIRRSSSACSSTNTLLPAPRAALSVAIRK